MIELNTIPLYLFAMYSINTEVKEGNPKTNEIDARRAIHKIVVQEMGHLALAGNLLTAVGGRPQLYGELFVPKYPAEILYEKVLMTLAPANQYQLQNFMEIEQPVHEKVEDEIRHTGKNDSPRAIPWYKSIGQFYEGIEHGITALHEAKVELFDQNSGRRQFTKDDTPHFNGDVDVILDKDKALDRLEFIVRQGEGGPSAQGSGAEKSHFEVFKEISQKNLDVYNLASNPQTDQFKGQEDDIYTLMLAFDAAYSYLLWSLEAVWAYDGQNETTRKQLKDNVHPLMMDAMMPIAKLLVKQNLKSIKNKRAGPAFNLYVFHLDGSPKAQLEELLRAAEKKAKEVYSDALNGLGDAVKDVYDLGNV